MNKTTLACLALALAGVLAAASGCQTGSGGSGSGGGSSAGGGGGGAPAPTVSPVSCPAAPTGSTVSVAGTNVLSIKVGGNALCSTNMPCASVTICAPGSNTSCQTINDILVDTGSFGLRIFKSAITSFNTGLLTAITDGSAHPLAECAEFGSANMWGSIVKADVTLGSEGAISSMPMQLVDSTFQAIPAGSPCASSVATAPGNADSPFNGILGIGLQPYDDYGAYYYCSGGTCHGYAPSTAQEVVNPVISLATDNNGVIVDMPSLSNDQANGATGVVIFGIGTGAHAGNNTPGAVTTYLADATGYFTTSFGGSSLTESFLDSGSNIFYFPGHGLAECSDGTICLAQTECFQATMTGNGGAPSNAFTFRLLGANDFLNSTTATDALAADGSIFGMTDTFDWGMPFFYGRKVYVGVSGKASSLGTGPYWAF